MPISKLPSSKILSTGRIRGIVVRSGTPAKAEAVPTTGEEATTTIDLTDTVGQAATKTTETVVTTTARETHGTMTRSIINMKDSGIDEVSSVTLSSQTFVK